MATTPQKHPFRLWTYRDPFHGFDHPVEASFVKQQGPIVELQKPDGKFVRIPMMWFSQSDIKVVDSLTMLSDGVEGTGAQRQGLQQGQTKDGKKRSSDADDSGEVKKNLRDEGRQRAKLERMQAMPINMWTANRRFACKTVGERAVAVDSPKESEKAHI